MVNIFFTNIFEQFKRTLPIVYRSSRTLEAVRYVPVTSVDDTLQIGD
jgi:hypothetical protein